MNRSALWNGLKLSIMGCLLLLGACTHPYFSQYYGEHVKRGTLTLTDTIGSTVSFDEAREKWMIGLTIPDPLFRYATLNRDIPGSARQGTIKVWAILYDQEVIDAWIRHSSQRDSISLEEAARYYSELHHTEEQFRIELKMESGFVPESLDPELWTLYLVDEAEIMYEPLSIQKEAITKKERRMYSAYHNMVRARQVYRRNVSLYFPKTTFFGKELLDPDTKLLRLVFSSHQETMGEAVWIFEGPQESR